MKYLILYFYQKNERQNVPACVKNWRHLLAFTIFIIYLNGSYYFHQKNKYHRGFLHVSPQ